MCYYISKDIRLKYFVLYLNIYIATLYFMSTFKELLRKED
nr:MAG TPA: hypothetical protein [Bacteriophage sp.]